MRVLLFASLAGILATACEHDASTRVLAPKIREQLLPQANRVRPGIESRYDAFVQSVPGFAGVALNSSNDVATVFFADARSHNAAAARSQAASLVTAMFEAMLQKLPSRFGGHLPALEFRTVNYDFGQLETWRSIVDNNSSDLSMWTIDVAQNRVIIGALTATTADRIRGLLAQNGVPADAYSVSLVPRAILTSTLTEPPRLCRRLG